MPPDPALPDRADRQALDDLALGDHGDDQHRDDGDERAGVPDDQ
jgi:hypothetical protein